MFLSTNLIQINSKLKPIVETGSISVNGTIGSYSTVKYGKLYCTNIKIVMPKTDAIMYKIMTLPYEVISDCEGSLIQRSTYAVHGAGELYITSNDNALRMCTVAVEGASEIRGQILYYVA